MLILAPKTTQTRSIKTDGKLFVDPSERHDLPEVFDDFENVDYGAESERWHRSKRNARKLEEFTKKTEVSGGGGGGSWFVVLR